MIRFFVTFTGMNGQAAITGIGGLEPGDLLVAASLTFGESSGFPATSLFNPLVVTAEEVFQTSGQDLSEIPIIALFERHLLVTL